MKLKNAPIVEAVLDIDCDYPPGFKLKDIESDAKLRLGKAYPSFRTGLFQEHEITGGNPTKMTIKRGLQSLQFVHFDQRQIVQLRTEGFSFNRLAPYSSLDDYYHEIERTWSIFVQITKPVMIRRLALRYINRILLPASGGKIELNDFLKTAPRLPMEDELTFVGFLNQHMARETKTGNAVNLTMTIQPLESDSIPFILDICAISQRSREVNDWQNIVRTVEILRDLKNRVFRNTLTERCLNLFQ